MTFFSFVYGWIVYRYVLAISILSTLYTGGQTLLKVHELSTGKDLFQRWHSALFDFLGDQVRFRFPVILFS